MTNLQEAPHFTKEMLIEAMRHLRGDFAAALSGQGADDRARSRLEHARKIGLDKLAPEAIAAIDRATEEVRNLTWPGGLDQRYLGLVGTVERLARASSELLPHESEYAHLTELAEVMQEANVAAGANWRAKIADKVRGVSVVVNADEAMEHKGRWSAEQALLGGATAVLLTVGAAADDEILELASDVRSACIEAGAALIIEGRADVAVATRAQGVHLDQKVLPITSVREVLSAWQIAGTCVGSDVEAYASLVHHADYIAVHSPWLSKVREDVKLDGPPVLVIDDHTPESASHSSAMGADGVCLATLGPEPREQVTALFEAFHNPR